MMFIIPYRNAHCFMPNFHTDFIFSKNLLAEKQVHFHAFKLDLIDPVTVDHGAPEPAYQQLAAILRAKIARGEWQNGHCHRSSNYSRSMT